jgi:hypothetical protein
MGGSMSATKRYGEYSEEYDGAYPDSAEILTRVQVDEIGLEVMSDCAADFFDPIVMVERSDRKIRAHMWERLVLVQKWPSVDPFQRKLADVGLGINLLYMDFDERRFRAGRIKPGEPTHWIEV